MSNSNKPQFTGKAGLATCSECKCLRRFREARVKDPIRFSDLFPIPWLIIGKLADGTTILWLGKNCNHGFARSELPDLKLLRRPAHV